MPGSYSTEPGHMGQLVSLAGVKGTPGHGQKTTQNFITIALGFNREAVAANLSRTMLIIQNSNTSPNWIGITFGDATPAAANIRLEPGDSIVIDKQMPWSGSIGFYNTGAECYALVQEFMLARTG